MRNLIYVFVTLVAGSIAFVSSAQAAPYNNWVFCSNCASDNQFIYAAVSAAPNRTGEYWYSVGNIFSEEFREVRVWRVVEGTHPLGDMGDIQFDGVANGQIASDLAGWNGVDLQSRTRPSMITVPEEGSVIYDLMSTSNDVVNVYMPTPSDAQEFTRAVKMVKSGPVFAPPTNSHGFDSYLLREDVAVSVYLHALLSAHNPTWDSGFSHPLIEAIKVLLGQETTACIIFLNGDSACYVMHIDQPSLGMPVPGSAKDAEGNPLPGQSYGGGGVGVYPNTPTRGSTTFSGGGYILSCMFRGGKLISCRID